VTNEHAAFVREFQRATAWSKYGTYFGVQCEAYPADKFHKSGAVSRWESQRKFSKEEAKLELLESAVSDMYCIDDNGRAPFPSAGNLQGVRIKVLSLKTGALYRPQGRANRLFKEDELDVKKARGLCYEQFQGNPHIVLFYADIESYLTKYGRRSVRFIYVEAGHACQEMIVAAQAKGLASCAIGAFDDSLFEELVASPYEANAALYALALGFRV
jgi:SagB-type dehydrogenase family enzyme